MEKVLFLAFCDAEGNLPKTALEALSAAKAMAEGLGGDWAAGLIGGQVQAGSNRIAGCGAGKIFGVSGDDFASARYASDAAAMEAICRASGATVVVGPADSRLSRVLAGVAQRLEGRVDAEVTAISTEGGQPAVTRWFYRQRMMGVVKRQQRPWLISIASGCFAPGQGEPGSAPVEAVVVELPDAAKRTTVAGIEAPSADEQTIRPDAKLLFVAGAGWTKKQPDGKAHVDDAETLILGFIKNAKASLGSSKSLVDLSGEGQQVLSFMTHLNQIGQTGATPRHPKGLAACCHGEEPHVVGWRFINERRAINLDPNCGWAQGKADVLYVADAFAVMSKVNAMLE